MVRRVYADLRLGDRTLPYRDILEQVRAHPEIARMNSHIQQMLAS
jgi:hypothetical protein